MNNFDKSKKYILGIETSCDDTSIALLLDNVVVCESTISSIPEQQKYGGVVPELASRLHLRYIHKIFINLLNEYNISIYEIKFITYTSNPGLIGSLHVGILFAKMLGKLLNIPSYNVNHIYGHIFSVFIGKDKKDISFPFISLIVSGGTSSIYLVESFTKCKKIIETNDDSVGEVYDKIARALGWEYPGGPIIDRLYDHNKTNIVFMKKRQLDSPFSFSGLKTAVLNYINTQQMKNNNFDKIEVASSFQYTIISELKSKLEFYLNKYNIRTLAIGGGVSANSLLRKECSLITNNLFFPEKKYTGDNATMIAYLGYLMYN